jgi:hypothetical protein
MDGGAAVQAREPVTEVSGSRTGGDVILRACGLKRRKTGQDGIQKLAYCLIYCLFSSPTRGYLIDSIDCIDRVLEV